MFIQDAAEHLSELLTNPVNMLQTDGSEPNKLVVMNADVVKVAVHLASRRPLQQVQHSNTSMLMVCMCSREWRLQTLYRNSIPTTKMLLSSLTKAYTILAR